MNRKKFFCFVILPLLLIISISVVVGVNIINSKKTPIILSEYLERGEYEGLSLTIYYMSLSTETFTPLSVEELVYGMGVADKSPSKKNDINGCYDYKISIRGVVNDHKNFEILKQLAEIDLIPVEHESYTNARIYYVFENRKGQKSLMLPCGGTQTILSIPYMLMGLRLNGTMFSAK